MSDDLRALNADQERRQPAALQRCPVFMVVDVAAFAEDGTVSQFRAMREGPYGLSAEDI